MSVKNNLQCNNQSQLSTTMQKEMSGDFYITIIYNGHTFYITHVTDFGDLLNTTPIDDYYIALKLISKLLLTPYKFYF